MGITNHVQNLRRQPVHIKKRYALAYSGAVTGVIFIVWLSILLPRGYNQAIAAPAPADNSFAQATGDIQQQFSQMQGQVQAVAQTASVGSAGAADASGGADASTTGAVAQPQQQYDFGY